MSWWLDLPLRRKGLVVVGLPTVTLLPFVVAALALNASQDNIRAQTRELLDVLDLAATVEREWVDVQNAVLLYAATGDDAHVRTWTALEASITRDAESLLADATGEAGALAEAVVADLLTVRDGLVRAAATGPDPASVEPADVRSAVVAVLDETVATTSSFDALRAQLEDDIERARRLVDDRSDQIIGALLGGVAMAAVVAWLAVNLFTRGIVQRVAEVREVTERVIDGATVIDIEEPADDEIGQLFRALRRAAELLLLHNAEMEASRDAERQRVEDERVLREMMRRVHQAVGQQGVLTATVRELGMAADADRVLVLAVEDDGMGPLLAEWHAPGQDALGVGRRLPVDEERNRNFGLLVRQRDVMAIDDVATSQLLPQTRELLGALGIGSVLLAPVVAEDDPLAAIVLTTAGRVRPWPPRAAQLAEAVASDVATALTHVRLYEREQEMVQLLRELDQAKSDFVASVSHELRTPLTSIRGYVEMLRDGDAGELQPEQEHMLDVVQRNADRLLALIEDLLTLSRIESGTFRVVRVPVALDDVVRTTVAELAPQAAGRGVELVAELEADVPNVLGDAGQLERVLLNLLSNAVKFTADGGRVVVRLRHGDGSVDLEVQDDGIGIPEGEQDRLFSRFFRSSTSQARAIQGTGLGLVIVKSIVDHHGGDISVRSASDAGTTFTVRLPEDATVPVAV